MALHNAAPAVGKARGRAQGPREGREGRGRRSGGLREVEVELEAPEAPLSLEDVDLDDVVGPAEHGLCNMSLDESLEQAALEAAAQGEAEEDEVAVLGHGVEDIDELDDEDPQCVTEYVNDIYRFLRAKEQRHAIDAGYMRKMQNDLNSGMRAILLDWLTDVGLKFKLLNDTTHMTTMLIDRYLSIQPNVSRKQLQLVGVSCMLVASKYEEIYAPEVRDFEYICDGAFSHQEILDMEVTVLNTLGFDICHPTPIHFLRRFSKAARSDSECHTLAKYLTELAAIHYESLRFLPSLLAASAVFLARTMHEQPDDEEPFEWNTTLTHYTGYSRAEIQPTVLQLAQWARDVQQPTAKLNACYRKYQKRFFGVATIRVPDNEELEI